LRVDVTADLTLPFVARGPARFAWLVAAPFTSRFTSVLAGAARFDDGACFFRAASRFFASVFEIMPPCFEAIVKARATSARTTSIVSPLRGVLQGGGSHTLEVAVTVAPLAD
jgi:hypothetical protein